MSGRVLPVTFGTIRFGVPGVAPGRYKVFVYCEPCYRGRRGSLLTDDRIFRVVRSGTAGKGVVYPRDRLSFVLPWGWDGTSHPPGLMASSIKRMLRRVPARPRHFETRQAGAAGLCTPADSGEITFQERGRAFYVFYGIGTRASPATRIAVRALLDSLRIGRR